MGICGGKSIKTHKVNQNSAEYKILAGNFTNEEIDILYLIFEDQTTRSEDDYLDKDTFLSFFP